MPSFSTGRRFNFPTMDPPHIGITLGVNSIQVPRPSRIDMIEGTNASSASAEINRMAKNGCQQSSVDQLQRGGALGSQ
jgi:hypothetical protein